MLCCCCVVLLLCCCFVVGGGSGRSVCLFVCAIVGASVGVVCFRCLLSLLVFVCAYEWAMGQRPLALIAILVAALVCLFLFLVAAVSAILLLLLLLRFRCCCCRCCHFVGGNLPPHARRSGQEC